ncbi:MULTISPECIES: hypothetical protein [Acidianus]|uniref:Transferase n=1 Tax=Candidatus Acidianus copahuensis TaxID=1160895 RepID=A0A031LLG8_9CREN|nr:MULTISPECIES: hypothetical protein [Acidianus]EZQ04912.1 transferase [Candidatus Acidianus copahuensis]NON61190.1 transferase [Acidianus sp. RZ1]
MAEGKIQIEAQVKLDGKLLEGARVYVHIKGYSRARVTHVDLEHDELKKVLRPRHSDYPYVNWEGNNVKIEVKGHTIEVISQTLGSLIHMKGNLYVGGKGKGLFLGFHKEEIKALEDFGVKNGFPPVSKRTKYDK